MLYNFTDGEIFKYWTDLYLQHPGALRHLLAQPELVAVVLVVHDLRLGALQGAPWGWSVGDLSLYSDLRDHYLLLLGGVNSGGGAGGGLCCPLSCHRAGGGSCSSTSRDQSGPVTHTWRGSGGEIEG